MTGVEGVDAECDVFTVFSTLQFVEVLADINSDVMGSVELSGSGDKVVVLPVGDVS